MNYKLNRALGLPLVTSKTIQESVEEQGLHTPSIGLTNPFDDKAAYDKRFFPGESPIPDLSLQGYGETINGERVEKPFLPAPKTSWTLPNYFQSDYRVKKSNFKSLKGLYKENDKFSNAADPFNESMPENTFKEPTKDEDTFDSPNMGNDDDFIAPRPNLAPMDQQEFKTEADSNGLFGIDKKRLVIGVLALGAGILAFTMLRKK